MWVGVYLCSLNHTHTTQGYTDDLPERTWMGSGNSTNLVNRKDSNKWEDTSGKKEYYKKINSLKTTF